MCESKKNQPLLNRWTALVCLVAGLSLFGCAGHKETLTVDGFPGSFIAGDIISTKTGKPVAFEDLLKDLGAVRVVYVGETHRDSRHHQIQLKIIKSLHEVHPNLIVGMEMFDYTYQETLDLWSAGELEEEVFLKRSHWYANWRYDFGLYREILEFAKSQGIRLVALNIPFHLPPKIAAGGLEHLGKADRKHLPQKIDTSNPDHREYVQKIFNMHRFNGHRDFESFYQAQCVWEDSMAEAVAKYSHKAPMVVLAGNGHIIRKFGIPDRSFSRTGAPYRTVYPLPVGGQASPDLADYLWITH